MRDVAERVGHLVHALLLTDELGKALIGHRRGQGVELVVGGRLLFKDIRELVFQLYVAAHTHLHLSQGELRAGAEGGVAAGEEVEVVDPYEERAQLVLDDDLLLVAGEIIVAVAALELEVDLREIVGVFLLVVLDVVVDGSRLRHDAVG